MKKNPFYILLTFALIIILGYRVVNDVMIYTLESTEYKLVDEIGEKKELGNVKITAFARTSKYDIDKIRLNPDSSVKEEISYDISRNGDIIPKEHKSFFRGKDTWPLYNYSEKNYNENENYVVIVDRKFKSGSSDYILYFKDKNTNKVDNILLDIKEENKNLMGVYGLTLDQDRVVVLMSYSTNNNIGGDNQILVYDFNLRTKAQSHGLINLNGDKGLKQRICSYLVEGNKLIMAMYPEGLKGEELPKEELEKYTPEKLWIYDFESKEVTKKTIETTVSFNGTSFIKQGEYIYLVDIEFGNIAKINRDTLEVVQVQGSKVLEEGEMLRIINHVAIQNDKVYISFESSINNESKSSVAVLDINSGKVLYRGKLGTGSFSDHIFTNFQSIKFQ